MNQKPSGEIIIYRTEDGQTQLDVRLERETIWLNLNQIAKLFERDKSVISRHLRNIFQSHELKKNSVVAKNATTAPDGKTYMVEYFNLDAILSVGYRVNSRRGTQFRIWATQVLKDHILNGYSINEKRLREENARLKELKETVDILGRIIEERQLTALEAGGLLKVVTDYSLALNLLDDYDYGRLTVTGTTGPAPFVITYNKAYRAISYLAKKSEITSSGLFGLKKDDSFQSSIGAIYQTFDRKELYPSIEEKAAHLLYFVVKNHSFVDGNKRIAAFLFLWFLDGNGILYRKDGTKRIGDNALVALTLMIAESRPGSATTPKSGDVLLIIHCSVSMESPKISGMENFAPAIPHRYGNRRTPEGLFCQIAFLCKEGNCVSRQGFLRSREHRIFGIQQSPFCHCGQAYRSGQERNCKPILSGPFLWSGECGVYVSTHKMEKEISFCGDQASHPRRPHGTTHPLLDGQVQLPGHCDQYETDSSQYLEVLQLLATAKEVPKIVGWFPPNILSW